MAGRGWGNGVDGGMWGNQGKELSRKPPLPLSSPPCSLSCVKKQEVTSKLVKIHIPWGIREGVGERGEEEMMKGGEEGGGVGTKRGREEDQEKLRTQRTYIIVHATFIFELIT